MQPGAKPDFPHVIDNTMRSEYKSCQRSWAWRFLNHRVGALPSVHLHAGGAFAAGLHVARRSFYDEGASPDAAVAAGWRTLIEEYGDFEPTGTRVNKTSHRMGEALVDYFREYPLGQDDLVPVKTATGSAVEFSFTIPLPIAHPQTGDSILYAGRFDMLGQTPAGQVFVVDEKTTGSLGEYWLTRYALSAQFTGYCWAARQFGYPVTGAIIRGIGILKEKFNHVAIPLMRPEWMVEEWYNQLLRDIGGMIKCWQEWHFEPNFADSCGAYGGCDYLQVCQVPEFHRDAMLAVNYAEREWVPVQGESDNA